MKKTAFLLFLILVIFTSINFVKANNLNDVKGHSFEKAIISLNNDNIINGYSDGSFKPNNLINRAEFLKILIEATEGNTKIIKLKYNKSCFPDVQRGEWFAPYACYAEANNIVNGYPDGYFNPSKKINIAEAAKIIVNTFGLRNENKKGEWYESYLIALNKEKNYLPNTLKTPNQLLRRGEMAEIIWRVSENITNKECSELGKIEVTEAVIEIIPEEVEKIAKPYVASYIEKPVETPIPRNLEPIIIDYDVSTSETKTCDIKFNEEYKNADMQKVREAWLNWVNGLRSRKGLQPLKLNNQLNRTANSWALSQRSKNEMTHRRTRQSSYYDYTVINNWFANQKISFTNISHATFSENIAWRGYSCDKLDCTNELIKAVETSYDYFVSEESTNGAHYRTMTNPYFKEVGLGIALTDSKYFLTVHYGTEVIENCR